MKNIKRIVALVAVFALSNRCMATPRKNQNKLTAAQKFEINKALAAEKALIRNAPKNGPLPPQAVQEFQKQEQVLQLYQNVPAAEPMISHGRNELARTNKAGLAAMQNATMILGNNTATTSHYNNFMKSFRGEVLLPNNTINPEWFTGALTATRNDLGNTASAQDVPLKLWNNVLYALKEYSELPRNRNNINFLKEVKASFDANYNQFLEQSDVQQNQLSAPVQLPQTTFSQNPITTPNFGLNPFIGQPGPTNPFRKKPTLQSPTRHPEQNPFQGANPFITPKEVVPYQPQTQPKPAIQPTVGTKPNFGLNPFIGQPGPTNPFRKESALQSPTNTGQNLFQSANPFITPEKIALYKPQAQPRIEQATASSPVEPQIAPMTEREKTLFTARGKIDPVSIHNGGVFRTEKVREMLTLRNYDKNETIQFYQKYLFPYLGSLNMSNEDLTVQLSATIDLIENQINHLPEKMKNLHTSIRGLTNKYKNQDNLLNAEKNNLSSQYLQEIVQLNPAVTTLDIIQTLKENNVYSNITGLSPQKEIENQTFNDLVKIKTAIEKQKLRDLSQQAKTKTANSEQTTPLAQFLKDYRAVGRPVYDGDTGKITDELLSVIKRNYPTLRATDIVDVFNDEHLINDENTKNDIHSRLQKMSL